MDKVKTIYLILNPVPMPSVVNILSFLCQPFPSTNVNGQVSPKLPFPQRIRDIFIWLNFVASGI